MIVDISTRLYSDEHKTDNVEHSVVISWYSIDDSYNTIQKVFVNDVDALITWIGSHKEQEEREG